MSVYENLLGCEDISDHNPINGEYLMHYGVKGMKWKTGKKVIGAIDKALGVEHEIKPVSGKTTKISSQKDLDKFNYDRSLKGQIENAGKKVKKKAKKTAKKVGKNLSKSANDVKKYVSKKKKKIEEFFD